jgi:hypothetical protein
MLSTIRVIIKCIYILIVHTYHFPDFVHVSVRNMYHQDRTRFDLLFQTPILINRFNKKLGTINNMGKQSFTPVNALIYWHYAKLKN